MRFNILIFAQAEAQARLPPILDGMARPMGRFVIDLPPMMAFDFLFLALKSGD